MSKTSLRLRRVIVSAIFLSAALVTRTAFSFYIPMFGQNGMRVGVAGVFSIMPSVLFGPGYGAAVSGLSDAMGFFLKPEGAYMPLMTLIMAAGGFLRGALWLALRGAGGPKTRLCVAAASALMLALGVSNTVSLRADGLDSHFYESPAPAPTESMSPISRMLVARTENAKDPSASLSGYIALLTAGLIGSAVFGLVLLLADMVISKKFYGGEGGGGAMRLLIAMAVSGLAVTTLNTVLLRETVYESWKVLPFAAVWIPRAIEEVLGNTVKAYFAALLLGVFESQRGLRELVLPYDRQTGQEALHAR